MKSTPADKPHDDGQDLARWLRSPRARFANIAAECDKVNTYATSTTKIHDLMLAAADDELVEAVVNTALAIAEERDAVVAAYHGMAELANTVITENVNLRAAIREARRPRTFTREAA